MSVFKKAFFSASSSLPLKFLFKQSGVPLLLPYHHVVSDEKLPHISNLYAYKNKKTFIKDLDWLLKNFTPVQPSEMANKFLSGEKPKPRSFLLTFDDGYREVHDVIAPILHKKGVPAIFFINPAFIDSKELFYRCKLSLVIGKMKDDETLRRSISKYFDLPATDFFALRKKILDVNHQKKSVADELGKIAAIDFDDFLQQQKPFLSRDQISKLIEQGFDFGAHSWDHPRYPLLPLQEQIDQTRRSLQFVRELQKGPYQYFAFPHQDKNVSKQFFSEIISEEKKLILFGLQNQRLENSNNMLHRYNAEDPKKDFVSVTKGILFYNTMLALRGTRDINRS